MTPLPRRKPTTARFAIALLFALALGSSPPTTRGEGPIAVEANRVAEVAFTSQEDRDDPFNEVELDVVFTGPDGSDRRVPGFWAGGRS